MIKFHADCVTCLMNSALKKIDGVSDERKRMEYMREICRIVRDTDYEREAAPVVEGKIIRLRREMLGITEDFSAEKHSFNRLLMGIYNELRAKIDASEDPLRVAIQLAMAGNYIDFGTVSDVNEARLMEMLDEAAQRNVDPVEYENLKRDIQRDGEIVYCHDNCGEIVLDKLLIETIKKCYSNQHIVSVVRGGNVQNDVTLEDAEEIALTEVSDEVISNGVQDIAGTELPQLPKSVYERISGAKLAIAKGQGNFETLQGSGMNIYYLFLCKCPRYTTWFDLERFSGVLANDCRLKLIEH